jgi:hypothetical protein
MTDHKITPAATGISERRIDCVGSERRLVLVLGMERIPISGLRPQAEALIRYMMRQNRANGDSPKLCSHQELRWAVWGNRHMSDEKAQVARLIFEIRQSLAPYLGEDILIQNVPGRGYILRSRGVPAGGQRFSFLCGPPITQPSAFFGRELELNRIYGVWNRLPLQHVAIMGPKRSGKTSLLHYLERIHQIPVDELRPGQKSRWLTDPEAYRIVFVDCQDARMRTQSAMMESILAQLGLPAPHSCSAADFTEILSGGIAGPTLLLFDELEAALCAPDVDAGFWTGLRSLAANHTRGLLGYVVAMHEDISSLVNTNDPQSPFLNIFGHTLTLGPLTATEALELVRSSPQPFPESDVEWILAESGRHPCLLQLLCDTRLTALEEAQPEELWKKEGLRRISRFRHLLEKA